MKKLFAQYETESVLRPFERKMLSAALEIDKKTAEEIMTPLSQCFMLDINTHLDTDLIRKIYE